jgi:hypothetical protein
MLGFHHSNRSLADKQAESLSQVETLSISKACQKQIDDYKKQ